MTDGGFTIGPVASTADLDDVRVLFAAYAASLPIDLAYQGFATELATLPGAYAPPAGALRFPMLRRQESQDRTLCLQAPHKALGRP